MYSTVFYYIAHVAFIEEVLFQDDGNRQWRSFRESCYVNVSERHETGGERKTKRSVGLERKSEYL